MYISARAFFEQMINCLLYTSPGAVLEEPVDIAVTPGESRFVPPSVKTVIDCDHRPCSYGMMVEIALRLGLEYLDVYKRQDPNFHNAVMHVEDENFGENIVAEELQKGYMYRDSVVRHSMVKVAN